MKDLGRNRAVRENKIRRVVAITQSRALLSESVVGDGEVLWCGGIGKTEALLVPGPIG